MVGKFISNIFVRPSGFDNLPIEEKLISHIISNIDYIKSSNSNNGITYIRNSSDNFESAYFRCDNKKNVVSFCIVDDSDGFINFLPWHLNTIDGLKTEFMVKGNTIFDIIIDETKDLNYIMNQIEYDNMLKKYDKILMAKKFKLI